MYWDEFQLMFCFGDNKQFIIPRSAVRWSPIIAGLKRTVVQTGRMLNIRKDCVILDGAVCSGERTIGSWFCPREIYSFWREGWLRRVEEADRARTSSLASQHAMSRIRDFVSARCRSPL